MALTKVYASLMQLEKRNLFRLDHDFITELTSLNLSSLNKGNPYRDSVWVSDLNRPFVGSGHMVRNELCWNANKAVGLSKQTNVGLDW